MVEKFSISRANGFWGEGFDRCSTDSDGGDGQHDAIEKKSEKISEPSGLEKFMSYIIVTPLKNIIYTTYWVNSNLTSGPRPAIVKTMLFKQAPTI